MIIFDNIDHFEDQGVILSGKDDSDNSPVEICLTDELWSKIMKIIDITVNSR